MFRHNKDTLRNPSWRKGAAVLGLASAAFGLTGCGTETAKGTPAPSETAASAPATPGASETPSPGASEAEAGVEMVGNINVANLGPEARAVAEKYAGKNMADMTDEEIKDIIYITPDRLDKTDLKRSYAEREFVSWVFVQDAGLTPEDVKKAETLGVPFDEYATEQVARIQKLQFGPDAQMLPYQLEATKNNALRASIYARLGNPLQPQYTLENVTFTDVSSGDKMFTANFTVAVREIQPPIDEATALSLRIDKKIASPYVGTLSFSYKSVQLVEFPAGVERYMPTDTD